MRGAPLRRQLPRLGVAALELVAGSCLLYVAWPLVFREYMDSPVITYLVFYSPLWGSGLLLVTLGARNLRRTVHASRGGPAA